MMRLLALALLFAMPLLACAAPIPKALKKKPAGIAGRWQTTGTSYNGAAITEQSSSVFVIEDKNLFLETSGVRELNRVDTVEYPNDEGDGAVNWNVQYSGQALNVYLGRYQIEGDRLVLCFSFTPNTGTRPTDTTSEQGRFVYTFKAVEDKK